MRIPCPWWYAIFMGPERLVTRMKYALLQYMSKQQRRSCHQASERAGLSSLGKYKYIGIREG